MHSIGAIDVLPVVLLLIFFRGVRPVRPTSSRNAGYLSIDTVKGFRGVLALTVVFHHLAQRTEAGLLFRCFTQVGFLAPAAFFFFSGYGLQKSYLTKQERYRDGFLARRLPPVLLPYIAMTALYRQLYSACGIRYSIGDIVSKTIHGEPIVPFSWFIISILSFYAAYWLLMILCKQQYFLMICGGCLWYILYTAYCINMGCGSWWYQTAHLLIVGMIWAVYEEKIMEILERSYFLLVPAVWLLFLVLFCFRLSSMLPIAGASLLLTMLTAVLFVISVLLFSLKFQSGNTVLRFLGDLSFEIYLVQGLAIAVFRGGICYIQSDFLWCVLVLAATVLFAYALHTVFHAIRRQYGLLRNKARP